MTTPRAATPMEGTGRGPTTRATPPRLSAAQVPHSDPTFWSAPHTDRRLQPPRLRTGVAACWASTVNRSGSLRRARACLAQ
jgi:hypothetical protein